MRVENQPYGRLQRDHLRPGVHGASLQAPDHRQHEGSRGGVDRRRARLLPDLLRAEQRDAGAGRRLRLGAGAGAGRRSTSAACRSPTSRCRATSRRSRRRRRRSASRCRSRGRCRRSSSRTTSPTTAIRTRIRCTSRRRCCPTARARASTASWSTRSSMALAAFGGGNIIEDPNLFYAVAIVQPGHTPEEATTALIAELDRLQDRADHRARAAAGQEPVRARLHPRPRVEPAEGRAAGARRGHPQRHQDRRRRVRHLPEHDRRPTCSASRRPTSRRRTGWC